MRGNSTKSSPLLCCHPAEFSIWTREAGAGGLSIAVEGPSKAEIAFEDRKDGSCGVSYVVQEPGRWSHLGWGQGFYLLTNGLWDSPIRHYSPCTPSSFTHSELSPGTRLEWEKFALSALILDSVLTSLLPQVTMRSPSSSMMSTSQTAPSWYPWPPSRMTLADSLSPASRSVPGVGPERQAGV